MPDAVCRMLTLLCILVAACPIGTNLGLLHLPWMPATRRAWAPLGQGDWTSGQLVGRWAGVVAREGQWQPHAHGGYCQ